MRLVEHHTALTTEGDLVLGLSFFAACVALVGVGTWRWFKGRR